MLNPLYCLMPVLTLLVLTLDSVWFQHSTSYGQMLATAFTAIYLVFTLRALNPERRLIVMCFIVVAIVGECLFSLVFRLYEYRMSNIPVYVPLAHPLLLVLAWTLADLPWLRRNEVVLAKRLGWFHLLAIIAVWLLWGDTLSLVFGVLGLYLFRRRRFSLVYGLMGFIVLVVELVGTGLGCWEWAASSAGNWLHSTNPPYGAFLGYVAADVASIKLARKISAKWFPAWQIAAP